MAESNRCPFCAFTATTYALLRLSFGLPAHAVQRIHRAQCVDLIDASVELVEQRLRSGAPTLLLCWAHRCPHSRAFMPEYERFARRRRPAAVRALRLELFDSSDQRPLRESALLRSLEPSSVPALIGMASGHVLTSPVEFFVERSSASVQRVANRPLTLGAAEPRRGSALRLRSSRRDSKEIRPYVHEEGDAAQVSFYLHNTEEHWVLEA